MWKDKKMEKQNEQGVKTCRKGERWLQHELGSRQEQVLIPLPTKGKTENVEENV